jgi:hypothetical protein
MTASPSTAFAARCAATRSRFVRRSASCRHAKTDADRATTRTRASLAARGATLVNDAAIAASSAGITATRRGT